MSEEQLSSKEKIVFFVKQGLDSFLGEIINALSDEYEVKKAIVTNYSQINEGMEWADICWFEWCDELVIYGSKLDIAKEKKIVCRLHSYEAFTDYITQVNWENVNKLICVSEFISSIIVKKTNIDSEKSIVIQNGIDIDKYNYKERKPGFNVAYVGYINYKKGPMLLLHTFKAIYEKDNRYKLYIAGEFQDERYVLYFSQMIKELGLENNVIYEGWQSELDKWLENKNYILCTSLLESQNISVMQGMSKGIKPIIHNFVAAKEIYLHKYVWNSIDEAVSMISNDEYNSKEYRDYIANDYSLALQKKKTLELLNSLIEKKHKVEYEKPLVTVGIINYNYKGFLDKSIMSVLNQNYENIEILIVDDYSTDGSIDKIKEYEKKYKNIKGMYHFQNSGSAILAFKDIIENASGEYLVFLSSDDYFYNSEVIKKYINEFSNDDNLDYVYGNIQIVNNEGENKEVWRYKDYSDNEVVYNTFRNMGSGVIPLTTGMFKMNFYHRNKLTFVDDPSNRVAGDTLNTLIYIKYSWNRKYKDFNAVCYRHHDNNMTYDIKNRIKSIISVMEYAASNFDVEILFPEIQWKQYDSDTREALKMYKIGEYYLKTLEVYYNEKIEIFGNEMKLDKEQIKEYVQPLITVIEKYLNKSISKNQLFSEDIKNINLKIRSMKIQSISIANSKKDEIYTEGQKLRNSLLSGYKDKYHYKNLKILIHSPKNGAWKYGFSAWKDILEYMGIKVIIFYDIKDITVSSNFDIFINIAGKSYIESVSNIKSITEIPHKVGLISKQDYFTNNDCTQQDLLNINLVNDFNYDFLITSFSQISINDVFKAWIDKGIKIQSIPFGFNPLIHYPEKAVENYDYFFVGTNSYRKIKETNRYLLPIISKYKGILRGSNWNDSVSELDYKNNGFFYNRARINLNYHLQSQKQYENEINERTFAICACGGFQLVDNPKILGKYYSGKEIAIANDEKEYLEKFIYYLNNPQERYDMAFRALIKTYDNNCSLFHRMDEILKHIM